MIRRSLPMGRRTAAAEMPADRSRRPAALRWLGLACVAAVLFLAGLARFVALADRPADAPAAATDAIVVLTGGSERIATGLALMAQGRADRMFVSGVSPGVTLDDLLAGAGVAPGPSVTCCVTLGHEALDTRGNAREAARWAAAGGVSSLRLVTANYHMPRSLLEFRRALPGVTILAHPVAPGAVHLDGWWHWPGTTSLVATEFLKYLAAAALADPSPAAPSLPAAPPADSGPRTPAADP